MSAWMFPVGVVVLGLLAPVRAHSQFEGIIRSRNTTTDESGVPQEFTMVMWVKEGRLRVETSPAGEEPGSLVIHRADLRLNWVVNVPERSYIEVQHGPAGEPLREKRIDRKPKLKRTGASRRILGYQAVQLLAHDGELETEMWGAAKLEPVARAIAKAVETGSRGEGASEITQDVAELGLFPLVARIRLSGQLVEESLVTSVQHARVPDSLFVLPAGFRRQVMDEMFDLPLPPRR